MGRTAAAEAPLRVTTVIPTRGGTHLEVAVQSALVQTYSHLDVVICVDGPLRDPLPGVIDDPRVRVVHVRRQGGPWEARAAGVAATDADLVAFLDDDDRWHPTKIERQVAAVRAAGDIRSTVVLCRMNRISPDGQHYQAVPRRPLREGQRLADYLFVRREVRPGESAAYASMMLAPRDLLAELGEPPGGAVLHEDWGVMLVLDSRDDVRMVMVDEVLVDYVVQRFGHSVSSRTPWPVSVAWFDVWQNQLTRREWADGMLTVTAVLAAEQGDHRGAWTVVKAVRRAGGGGWRAWVFLLLTVVVPARRRLQVNRLVETLRTRGRDRAAVTRSTRA